MDDTQEAHLAGVFDAAGGVALRVSKDKTYKLNYNLRPHLSLRRYNEEDPILGKLMEYSDEKSVKYSIGEKTGQNQENPSISWTVTDPDSVGRFLEPLMNHLVTNYFRAELMLEVVIPSLRNGDHLNKQGFYELVGVAEKLREGKQLRVEPKYTQDFFEEEWSNIERR
ncbi:hypothetical protein [Halorubrum ezzemoulense]|uniref:hypothetical protein n=1 Tax=Halorubrum ezzemoulense TaxID=337243 RepID=UPI0023315A53|nr:hypothetical protein [Halorubrum ezzemoulense]MDB2240823.1 hypothetical protein [Halorubrum ezzemoulense]